MLDLVFTTQPSLVTANTTIPGISDHDIIITDFDTRPLKTPPTKRKTYKFNSADWKTLKEDLEAGTKLVTDKYNEGEDTDGLWTMFKTNLQQEGQSPYDSLVSEMC